MTEESYICSVCGKEINWSEGSICGYCNKVVCTKCWNKDLSKRPCCGHVIMPHDWGDGGG